MTLSPAHPTPRGFLGSAAAIMLALSFLMGGCGAPDSGEPDDTGAPPPEEMAAGPTDGLQLILGADQIRYAPNEMIRLRIRVVNRLDESRTLTFATGQRVDAVLLNSDGSEVRRWSEGQLFTQALGEVRFDSGEAGESWELDLVAPETPGSYSLVGMLVATPDTLRASLPVEIGSP